MKNKVAKTSFVESSLPQTRRQLFADIIKNHWRTLLLLGLFLFVGLLPFMGCLLFRDLASLSYSMAYSRGDIDANTRESLVRTVHFYASIGEAASLFVFSIPLSGSLRIMRQLAWLDPIFFKEDFGSGIKDNYWGCAIASFFSGLIMVGIKAMMFTAFNNVFVIAIIIGFFIVLVLPPLFLSIAQGTVYKGTFRQFNRNSIALYLKHAPLALLFTSMLVCPFLLEMIQSAIVIRFITMAIVVYFVPPLSILAFLLFSYFLFDEYINKEQFKDIYKRGLYTPTKEDKKAKNHK
ncbi:MAG: hypothetical protein MJ239_04095 [Bacilli bacterium]|nr:hypothetical protein [Bacilli bacterium]